MPYTTQQDLENAAGSAARFIELADRDGDGVADAAVIAQAQSESDGWIDSFLRKFSPADLAALRATPTPTIKRIAAKATIIWFRETSPMGPSQIDIEERKLLIEELKGLRADDLRPADTKTTRASFIDNTDDVSREGTKGMW